MILQSLMISINCIFTTKEGTFSPIQTAFVAYTRSRSDEFEIFQAKSAIGVTHCVNEEEKTGDESLYFVYVNRVVTK